MSSCTPEHQDQPGQQVATSRLAIFSLVLSLLSYVCLWVVGGLIGAILGVMALAQISSSEGRLSGRGLAIAGIVLGVINFVMIGPLLILGGLLLPAVQKVRAAANKMLDATNMRQIGIAMHHYHNERNQLPTQAIMSPDGKPLLSWRVALLPYLEQNDLYRQFHLDEPWDSPHNMTLLERMPKCYQNPARRADQPGYTYYQVFVGRNAAFDPSGKITLAVLTVQDGASTTAMLAEASTAVPWTKPEDIVFDFNPGGPMPQLGGAHPGGFNVLFADCSTRFVRKSVQPEVLRSLIDRRDGKAVNWNDIE
jgi:prepilin-type processing-associated H-X9-DG protein